MKKLIVIAFMIVASAASAQVNNAPTANTVAMNSAKSIEIQSQKMKADLGLSDDQVAQIKTLLAKQQQDLQAVRTEVQALKASGQQLTDTQKSEIKAKFDAQRTAVDTQLKTILTPDQYAKWQSNMAPMKGMNSPKTPTAG